MIPSWDEYFLQLAKVVASRSRDPRTQVGAVLVGPEYREIRATGYNGFPRGVPDTDPDRWASGEKGFRVVHAEMNTILAAARTGATTQGCTLYCTLHPCIECTKAICQAGIARMVISLESLQAYQSDWLTPAIQERVRQLFQESQVWFGAL
jgi:dCMP deaminase